MYILTRATVDALAVGWAERKERQVVTMLLKAWIYPALTDLGQDASPATVERLMCMQGFINALFFRKLAYAW
eukprot:7257322-Alexandrium_andersonii.AAC.1